MINYLRRLVIEILTWELLRDGYLSKRNWEIYYEHRARLNRD